MTSVLLVTSSPRGAESVSSKVASELATAIAKGGNVTVRDLGKSPIPHLDTVTTAAIRKAPADRTPEEAAAADFSDKLVAELASDQAIAAADTLLLTVPNQLGVDYNAHVIEAILKHVAPALGWR